MKIAGQRREKDVHDDEGEKDNVGRNMVDAVTMHSIIQHGKTLLVLWLSRHVCFELTLASL